MILYSDSKLQKTRIRKFGITRTITNRPQKPKPNSICRSWNRKIGQNALDASKLKFSNQYALVHPLGLHAKPNDGQTTARSQTN